MLIGIYSQGDTRREAIEELGYRMVCFWEMDYKQHGVEYIDQLLTKEKV